MPCDSSYLEPTYREREFKRAAVLYEFVLRETGQPIDEALKRAAIYCYGEGFDSIPILCAALTAMPESERDRLMTQRNRTSRDLANWWEEHQEHDKLKLAKP